MMTTDLQGDSLIRQCFLPLLLLCLSPLTMRQCVDRSRRAGQTMGRTVVVAAIEGRFAALFGLMDTVRPEVKDVVAELQRRKLEVWMVTGDNRRAALEVRTDLRVPLQLPVASGTVGRREGLVPTAGA